MTAGAEEVEAQDLSDLIRSGDAVDLAVTKGPDPMSAYAVRLPGAVIDRAQELASNRGIATGALMRSWIIQRLEFEEGRPDDMTAELWDAAEAAALRAVPSIAATVAQELRSA